MKKLLTFLQYKNFGGRQNLGFIWKIKPSDTKVTVSHNSVHTVKLSSDLPTDTVDSKSLRKFKKGLDHLKKNTLRADRRYKFWLRKPPSNRNPDGGKIFLGKVVTCFAWVFFSCISIFSNRTLGHFYIPKRSSPEGKRFEKG